MKKLSTNSLILSAVLIVAASSFNCVRPEEPSAGGNPQIERALESQGIKITTQKSLEEEIIIPDRYFQAALREVLKKPEGPILPSDLAGLERLDLDELFIRYAANLSGLERCSGLRNFSLSGSQVRDLSPLARLQSLETIVLKRTQVDDLAPLAGLTKL